MLSIEEMNRRRKYLGYTYAKLAEVSGVPVGTLQKIFGGYTKSPRYETILALERILSPETHQTPGSRRGANSPAPWEKTGAWESAVLPVAEELAEYHDSGYDDASDIAETLAAYEAYSGDPVDEYRDFLLRKKQGEYTTEDLENLPEDLRFELIDGYLYALSSPTIRHQDVVGEVFFQIKAFIKANKGPCHVYMAPLDTRIDQDNRTSLQPDVFVVCRQDIIMKKNIFGAPDFIAEVLSPSTRGKDRDLKCRKYFEAGVREYWMIDPEKRIVYTYDWTETERKSVQGMERAIQRMKAETEYRFDQPVPVKTFREKLTIDLSEI